MNFRRLTALEEEQLTAESLLEVARAHDRRIFGLHRVPTEILLQIGALHHGTRAEKIEGYYLGFGPHPDDAREKINHWEEYP